MFRKDILKCIGSVVLALILVCTLGFESHSKPLEHLDTTSALCKFEQVNTISIQTLHDFTGLLFHGGSPASSFFVGKDECISPAQKSFNGATKTVQLISHSALVWTDQTVWILVQRMQRLFPFHFFW
ncbi:MAG: hypothetical protein ACI8ZN_001638 [Bacteroidia bacterium]